MPAARLIVAKTAWDVARYTGFTRFSESARPSYDNSNPPSYIKRRSARTLAKIRDSLPAGTGAQDIGARASMSRVEDPESEMQRASDASHVELVNVESGIVDLKAMA